MTNKFVRRFDPPTAQWIAPSTARAGGRSAPVLIEIGPAMGNRFCGFVGLRLHTSQAPQDQTHLAPGEPGHGRFAPLYRLSRGAIVGLGHPMEVLDTVRVIEYLTRLGKQCLDMFP